jgi:predicted aconitase with swiveling domain
LWGRGNSVQGSMLIFPRGGCGSTTCAYLLTYWSAKQIRSWCLAAREPS